MRFYEDKDYETICEWWKTYNFPEVPKECLPKNGLIIDDKCAGFLYCTDSAIVWMEFIVANRRISKEERSASLDELITGLLALAKEFGYTTVFTSVQHPRLAERFENLGFKKTDINMTNFIRSL